MSNTDNLKTNKPKKIRFLLEDGEMRQERRSRGDPSAEGGDTGPPRTQRTQQESRLGIACVELHKKEGCNLGLIISGGIDKDVKSSVSYLKPGGIAHRSDVLQQGDYILSVNGVQTTLLRHEEIVNLLRGAGERIMLEIEYELPESPQNSFSVLCKRIEVTLERDSGSYGFTLRGGLQPDGTRFRPLTVTQIRPGGAADREGTLKVGDRILSINGVSSAQCSLMDALTMLRNTEVKVTLGVEYDVSVMEAVERAAGPLLVEIDKASGSPLGLSVTSTLLRGKPVICIDNIQPASIADRCGALHIGDHILALDETSFEHVSVAEAMQILKRTTGSHVKLEIVPIRHIKAQSQSALLGQTEVEIHERVRSLKENGTLNARQRGRSSSPILVRQRIQPERMVGTQGETRGNQVLEQQNNGEKWSSTSSKGSSLTDKGSVHTDRGSSISTERGSVNTDRGSISTDKSGASKSSLKPDRVGNDGAVNNNNRFVTHPTEVVNSRGRQNENVAGNGMVNRRTCTLPCGVMNNLPDRHQRMMDNTHTGRDGNGRSLSLGRGEVRVALREPVEPETFVSKTMRQQESHENNRNNANNAPTKDSLHSSQTSLQSLAEGKAFKAQTGQYCFFIVGRGPEPKRHSTYTSMTTQMGSASNSPPGTLTKRQNTRQNGRPTRLTHGLLTPHSSMSFTNVMLPGHQVCHTEVTEVILVSDLRGFGLSLGGNGQNEDILDEPPFISFIEPRSVAERCGVLQEGDRILTVNGTVLQGKTLDSALRILNDSGIRVCILVEFDVAESIIPSSGIFNVKVAKKGAGLGITIAAPRERKPTDALIISDVKRGSVAHRTGTLHPRDKLLAINTFRLEGCSVEDAADILEQSSDIVKLRLQKDDNSPDEPVNMVTYTVELQRRGGPLGVTISGTEEPLDPIFISGLTEGGLAERTGALHIGDRILAINQQSLRGKTLTDAITLLQTAGDTVTLKVTRPLNPHRNFVVPNSRPMDKDISSPQSVDSALESWDSSGLDSNSKPPGKPRPPDGLIREGSGSSSTGTSSHTSHDPIILPPPPSDPHPQTTYHSPQKPTSQSLYSTIRPKSATSYNDLSQQLAYTEIPPDVRLHDMLSPGGSSSPGDSVASSAEQDQWSRQLDELDHLGPLTHHSNADHFSSGFSSSVTTNHKGGVGIGERQQRGRQSVLHQPSQNISNNNRNVVISGGKRRLLKETDLNDLEDTLDLFTRTQHEPTIDFTHSDLNAASGILQHKHDDRNFSGIHHQGLPEGAEMELREVEEQLNKMLTPTPVELHRVTLKKADEPDYGFSLSDGVYEKGVYISALRPGGPAERSGIIKTYDRILQINAEKVGELDCHQVVPLIARVGAELTLVISRNPLAEVQLVQDDDDASSIWESASMILDSKMV